MKHSFLRGFKALILLILFVGLSHISSSQSYRLPAIITYSPVLVRQAKVDSFNKSQPEFATLTKHEQEMLYWLNVSRQSPRLFYDKVVAPAIADMADLKQGDNWKTLMADLYAAPPLPMFKVHAGLLKIARSHATDLSSRGVLSHDGANGKSIDDRFTSVGITHCGGENLAACPGEPYMGVILLYLDLGVPSLGHRKAFMNPLFTKIGLAAKPMRGGNSVFVFDFTCED